MAGTVIDSLVVELGLDPSKFTAQQQQVVDKYKKGVEEIKKQSKDAEDASAKLSDSIGGLRMQALEMFAVFSGGKGVIDFISGINHADASLGRISRSTGASAETLSKWQAVARLFGGDAQTMAQSFISISDAFAGWKVGVVSPLVADFRAISTAGGKIIDVNKGVEQSFLDLADNLRVIHDRDPAQAGFLARRLGLDPAMIDILIQGSAKTKEFLDYVEKIGVATRRNTEIATQFEQKLADINLRAESLYRRVQESWIGNAFIGMNNGAQSDVEALLNIGKDPMGSIKSLFGIGPAVKPSIPSSAGTSSAPSSAAGAFTSQSEKEAFIRSEAAKRGIDPDVALRVAKSEGFAAFTGDNGTSFGAFQLHVTPGGRGGAVGDQFRAATGLDPGDPANERATIQFALDNARRNGWADYHGAARVGIDNWAGIGPMTNSTSTSNSTSIHIDKVEINSGQNADGTKMAQDFRRELLSRQSFAAQGNIGQN